MNNISTTTINEASQSKAAFISFIHHIELPSICPWVISWLEEFFTDTMAQVFPQFHNGSYDDQTIILPSGEILPSLIDDIETVMGMVKSNKLAA